ncbi:MAG: M81 family metallopeptidase [Gammaproteobacteria bacterium]|nr:M81 family metallopeptidase [Gammaproteobacteria bacterium]
MTEHLGPRVALCGVSLESNAFSPVAKEADFRSLSFLEGSEILDAARGGPSSMSAEMRGFVRSMDVTGPWQPVPLTLTASHPWGPVDQTFFDGLVDSLETKLRREGPVDAVFVANHGAMVATRSPDPDGDMLGRLRKLVGADTPIIATLDLHANVSEAMAESATVLVAYLTNPHVDMLERGEEAAHILRSIVGGTATPKSAFIRMPLVPSSVTLLTHEGPYADLIDYGQRRKREMAGDVLNVSILGNFAFSDTPFNGIGIVVTGRHSLEPAQRLARELAVRCWEDRERFRKSLTSLDDAVAKALHNGATLGAPALIYSDSGDNPGGGGGGDTTQMLAALLEANARGVLYGSFFDRPLVADAVAAGEGATINAVFNREPHTSFGTRLEAQARVVKLSTEPFVGRLGIYAGKEIKCHPACVLELGGPGGISVVVISNRYQTADPMFFEHFGLDVGAARTVCVKSRGHFRAGFSPWFGPEQVLEVDTAGLTSPVLERLEWKGLPRPVYPLDEDTDWVAPNW